MKASSYQSVWVFIVDCLTLNTHVLLSIFIQLAFFRILLLATTQKILTETIRRQTQSYFFQIFLVDVDKFNLLLNVVEPIVKEKFHSFEDSFRNRNEKNI